MLAKARSEKALLACHEHPVIRTPTPFGRLEPLTFDSIQRRRAQAEPVPWGHLKVRMADSIGGDISNRGLKMSLEALSLGRWAYSL